MSTGHTAVNILILTAIAGIVIGVVSLTGLGLKISTMIIDVSHGHSIAALVLSAIACLIMGMGLPTQIIYLTLAILVAPGLIDMGISKAGAHLFIMYFGMMSMVTPPVCFAAFAAASLSGAKMMRTGMNAFRLALAGQLVPFYFAYNPGLLLIGSPAAVRAVGLANGANPIAIVVPCHRVIGADGSLTGYGGGLARKRWLLAHEGAELPLASASS